MRYYKERQLPLVNRRLKDKGHEKHEKGVKSNKTTSEELNARRKLKRERIHCH